MLREFEEKTPPPASGWSPSPRNRGEDWGDYVVPQCWDAFTSDDHAVWDLLFARQAELLGSRVVARFLDGIDLLRLSHPGVPELAELNVILEPRTGWRTVAVPGLVPDDVFFAMLADRVFPVGNFIRTREQLDYLEAPDCFHDLFGHIPMLASRVRGDGRACRPSRLGGHCGRRGRARRAALLA
jgi:phenylalanine-4-hydroxylase